MKITNAISLDEQLMNNGTIKNALFQWSWNVDGMLGNDFYF